jgi:hypothetical protein
MLAGLRTKFELLHNHPGSSLPSVSDIKGLFHRVNASGSTVVCHNGDIYRMEKIKQFKDIELFDNMVDDMYNKNRNVYSKLPRELAEFESTKVVISLLEEMKYIKYYKVV